MLAIHTELGGGVLVDMGVPQSGCLDQGAQFGPISAQLRFQSSRRTPLRQRAESRGGYVVLTPEGEIRLVRGANDIGKVRQPDGEGIVLGMGFIRPDALENKLEIGDEILKSLGLISSSPDLRYIWPHRRRSIPFVQQLHPA